MTRTTLMAPLVAALFLGSAGAALARGNSDSGSGLSPYAALSGNDRSAGVNSGNYRDPGLDPYLRAYDPAAAASYVAPPAAQPRLRMRPYYGRPY